MSIGVAKMLKDIAKIAPEIAIKYAPDMIETTQHGMEYLQGVIKINNINLKTKKVEKKKIASFEKIGKAIYLKKISINDVLINDEIERIMDFDSEIDINNNKIKEIEEKIKRNKVFDNAQKVFTNTNKEIEKKHKNRSRAAKKAAKTRKMNKNEKM